MTEKYEEVREAVATALERASGKSGPVSWDAMAEAALSAAKISNGPFACHCEVDIGEQPEDDCVLDAGRPQDCTYARDIKDKFQCKYWHRRVVRG